MLLIIHIHLKFKQTYLHTVFVDLKNLFFVFHLEVGQKAPFDFLYK